MKKKATYLLTIPIALAICACAQQKPLATVLPTVSSTPKQESNFTLIKTIKGNFSYLNVDVLDNIYVITSSNQLKKINANGDSAGIFNDVKQFGNPSLIDVNNPLKILVYYKNFSTVVILDRFLTFRSSINFRKTNIFKVNCITTAYDNNIWIFNEQDFTLTKINDDGTVISKTNDFRQIFDKAPTPSTMYDNEGYIYLYDPVEGFFIFDYYGSLKNSYPFLNWTNIAITNNYLYGFTNNTIQTYTLRTLTTHSYTLPAYLAMYKSIKAINGKLYLLKDTGIEIYKINIEAP